MEKRLLSPFPIEKMVVDTQSLGVIFKFPPNHRDVHCCTGVAASVDHVGSGTQGS